MDYTFEKDENGNICNIFVNGKPVKRSFMRGFKKAQEKSYFLLCEADYTARNPFSGVRVKLNGLEATIFLFCMNWYRQYEMGFEKTTQVYDDMKYFLLEINPNAYMDLID